jgi:hypothetical protein
MGPKVPDALFAKLTPFDERTSYNHGRHTQEMGRTYQTKKNADNCKNGSQIRITGARWNSNDNQKTTT